MKDKKMVGKGVKFERIRRITGYLASLTSFNNAKRAEEKDRVKHGGTMSGLPKKD